MKQPDARFPTMVALREALLDPENYLHRSPPMAPARSLAPGEIKVDAKTVMAYAAQQQQTRLGLASDLLPLVSPPSLSGAASQATMIGDGSLIPPRMTAGPNMSVPAPLKTNTMRIATPLGYSSQPQRRVWPIVLVIALLMGLGGGGFAVAWFGRKNTDPSAGDGSATNSGSAVAAQQVPADAALVVLAPLTTAAAPSDAAKAVAATAIDAGIPDAAQRAPVAIDAGVAVAAVKTAEINIDSVPSGADIYGADNQLLGKTPATFKLPLGATPVTIELRLPGYRKKSKQLVVTENMVIQVPLERLPPVTVIHRGSGSGKRGSSDDLERP